MPLCRISLCRIALIVTVVSLTLAAAGCAVPGLGGKGAKTARAGGANVDAAGGGGSEDISAFSPEVSMQRDLLQLREREAGQRETVENMRMALRQGGEDVQREEERLRDIQMQIERYDSAMKRYEMAGRYALPADGRGGEGAAAAQRGAAARGGMDYGYNTYNDGNAYGMDNAYAAGRGDAGQSGRLRTENGGGEYGRDGNLSRSGGRGAESGMANGMRGMGGAANANGREEVLYAGAYDPRLAEQPAPVGDLTLRRAAGRGTAGRRPMFEDEAADAGAFAARSPAAEAWNQPQPAPARPGSVELAAVPGRVQPTGQQGKPASRPMPPAAAVEARPAVPEDDGLDEVFTPDLFLSRR